MAGILTLLDQPRTLSALGKPVSANIYFYYTGGTVLAPIWQDKALTVPRSNPVVVAAGEIFPETFLDETIVYRRRIEYADGSIYDVDPFDPSGSSGVLTTLASAAGASLVGVSGGGTVQDVIDDLGTLSTQDASSVNITGGDISVDILKRPGFYNFNSNSFPRWSAALAKQQCLVSQAKMAIIGDSTTSGVGSNPSSATSNSRVNAYPAIMAKVLNLQPETKAQANSIWCDGLEGSNIGTFDPRITLASGWVIHPTLFCAGGKAFYDPTTGSPNLTFNVGAGIETDTLDIYAVRFPGYADIVVTTNGTFNGSGSTNGASGIVKITVTRSADKTMPWVIQKSGFTPSADLLIVGLDAYVAADKPISVWNMGASGSKVADWVADNQPYSFINAIQVFAPDLSIICLTINDWAANTPEATYKSGLQQMITSCLVTGDVLLVVGVPSNTGTAPIQRQKDFARFVKELAKTNNLPVVDLSERWISQALYPSRGNYYDGLHPSISGYRDIAHLLANLTGNPGFYNG